jgi:hypothetical protein
MKGWPKIMTIIKQKNSCVCCFNPNLVNQQLEGTEFKENNRGIFLTKQSTSSVQKALDWSTTKQLMAPEIVGTA